MKDFGFEDDLKALFLDTSGPVAMIQQDISRFRPPFIEPSNHALYPFKTLLGAITCLMSYMPKAF